MLAWILFPFSGLCLVMLVVQGVADRRERAA
jgi:hypothetical protein